MVKYCSECRAFPFSPNILLKMSGKGLNKVSNDSMFE